MEERISRAQAESRRHQAETEAMLKATKAVLRMTNFQTAAHSIFDIAKEIIGATGGYVALLSDDGAENEVLFLDSGGRPCSVDENLPMPIRGLRAESYHLQRVVYENDFPSSRWLKFMPQGHVYLENVLFAPLIEAGKAVGLIGLANKPAGFNDNDVRIAGALGEVVSIALINSHHQERLKASEELYRNKTMELEKALRQVKSLSGLLPICASCKNIRDDRGYWQAVESYITTHSEAEFSHGLCPTCIRKLYPEMADEIIASLSNSENDDQS